MGDAFSGVRLKLLRAADEAEALGKEIEAFLNGDPYPYRAALDFNIPTRIITFSVHVEKTPDPMWGVRIGEIVHNFRSALDHVIWELVILTTGQPPAPSMKNQFPIFETEEGFNKRGVGQFLRGVRADAIEIIRSEQPYFTGEQRNSPLWHLHELSNADKHRTLCVAGSLLRSFEFELPPLLEALSVDELEMRQAGPIQQNAVLYRGRLGGRMPYPFAHNNVKGQLATNIAFDESTPTVGGWLVRETLADILTRTERVTSRIAKDIFRIEL